MLSFLNSRVALDGRDTSGEDYAIILHSLNSILTSDHTSVIAVNSESYTLFKGAEAVISYICSLVAFQPLSMHKYYANYKSTH